MSALVAAILGGVIGAIATGAVLYVLERKKEERLNKKRMRATVSIFINEINLIVRLLNVRFNEILDMVRKGPDHCDDRVLVFAWDTIKEALKSIDDNLHRFLLENFDSLDEKVGEHVWAFIRTGRLLFSNISDLLATPNNQNIALLVCTLPRLAITLKHGYQALYDLAIIKDPDRDRENLKAKIVQYSEHAKKLNRELLPPDTETP
ncbi:MAG: hypothetical protein AB1814_05395 [Thermodesulfobacteriota bacterium]